MTPSGPLSEDPELRTVAAPDEYPGTTGGPVRLHRVIRRRRVMGYLWAAADGEAAGFVARQQAGDDGLDVAVAWVERLRAARSRGLTPQQALGAWVGAVEDPRAGRVDPAAFEVGSLAGLEREAGR
jgi:glycine/D-amino acid oxidase-like deaminating enzyme